MTPRRGVVLLLAVASLASSTSDSRGSGDASSKAAPLVPSLAESHWAVNFAGASRVTALVYAEVEAEARIYAAAGGCVHVLSAQVRCAHASRTTRASSDSPFA